MSKNFKNRFCDIVRYYASYLAMSCFLGKAREEWEKNYKKTIEQSKNYEKNSINQKEKESYYNELEFENKLLIKVILKIDKFAEDNNIDAIKKEIKALKGEKDDL